MITTPPFSVVMYQYLLCQIGLAFNMKLNLYLQLNYCISFCLSPESVSMEKVHYCERFIELMIDLEVR